MRVVVSSVVECEGGLVDVGRVVVEVTGGEGNCTV